MSSKSFASSRSRMDIIGWAFSVVGGLALVGTAVAKLVGEPMFAARFVDRYGYQAEQLRPLGVVELALVGIYLLPATRLLGAILLASYLGGAVATLLRVGQSVLPPVFIGIFLWMGLYLRDRRLRALLPFGGQS